jgi:clan AA aspartic protease
LVDTGAFYTVIPRDALSALHIEPIREETVQFADGRKARWKVGEARLDIDGRSVTTLVLFGKVGTQPLLGAYSIEGLGLSVDTRHRRLVPMPVVIVASSGPAKSEQRITLEESPFGAMTLECGGRPGLDSPLHAIV